MSNINSALIGEAFDKKIRPLIDIVDKLRKIGLQQHIKLPNVVVVGDQSSGKSSIIEAISGIELPRGKGIVTRCPLELQLVRVNNNLKWKAILTYRNKEVVIQNPKNVELQVKTAQNNICGDGNNISDELLTLRIESSSPQTPDLTLIDLPGIARIPMYGQDPNICQKIRKMIGKYVSKENTVILCVISSDLDLAVNEALGVAAIYDPNKERTIGVLTKPDKTDNYQKEDIIKLLNNESFILKKGYRVVRCRSQDELDVNMTLEESIINEKLYFENDEYFKIVNPELLGVLNLANKITVELKIIIEKTLPILKEEIKNSLENTQNEMNKLPVGVPNDLGERRIYLFKILHEMLGDIKSLLKDGKFNNEKNNQINNFKIWRKYFEEFQLDIVKKQNESEQREFSLVNLEKKILDSRGREFYGFINYDIFEEIASEHVSTYSTFADRLLECIKQSTENNVMIIADKHLKHLPEIHKDIKSIIIDAIGNANNQAIQHIKFIFEEEKIVFTMDNVFHTHMNNLNQPFKLTTTYTLNQSTLQENTKLLQKILLSYLKIAQTRLSDIVPMTIRQWIHIRLSKSIENQCLKYASGTGNESKITENSDIKSQRQKLMEKFQRLTQGKISLDNFSC